MERYPPISDYGYISASGCLSCGIRLRTSTLPLWNRLPPKTWTIAYNRLSTGGLSGRIVIRSMAAGPSMSFDPRSSLKVLRMRQRGPSPPRRQHHYLKLRKVRGIGAIDSPGFAIPLSPYVHFSSKSYPPPSLCVKVQRERSQPLPSPQNAESLECPFYELFK